LILIVARPGLPVLAVIPPLVVAVRVVTGTIAVQLQARIEPMATIRTTTIGPRILAFKASQLHSIRIA
jgi:hypothetical protein